jgi:hypothetical protein
MTVILKATAKKISWLEAEEIIGGLRPDHAPDERRYQKFGYTGLMDRRRGKLGTPRRR